MLRFKNITDNSVNARMAYVDKTKESMRDDYHNDKMYNAELFTMLMTHFATGQNRSMGPVYSI